MKLVLSNLIFGMFVCCLETQASESMLPSDYEEHISIHSPTPEELKKAIGEEKS